MKSTFTIEILLTASGVVIASAIFGLVIERFVLRRLDKLAHLTPWEVDEIVIVSFKGLT